MTEKQFKYKYELMRLLQVYGSECARAALEGYELPATKHIYNQIIELNKQKEVSTD